MTQKEISITKRSAKRSKFSATPKADPERMKKIMESKFIFGFDLSDLFIISASFLTILFLQFGDLIVPALESFNTGKNVPVMPAQIPGKTSSNSLEKNQESTPEATVSTPSSTPAELMAPGQ